MATKPGCAPLKAMYERAVVLKAKTWNEIEDDFLRAMEGFDANVASGAADIGGLQNGKGDFFDDLLTLLLENCAGVTLYSRGGVPGLTFPKHNLDATFPSSGVVEFLLEAKAVGTPKHPLSPKQKPIGRPGSADLDKCLEEIEFNTIDLKAEYARTMVQRSERPATAGDQTTWLHSVKPRSYVFIAARVISENDQECVLRTARAAQLACDAVGVYCYAPCLHPSRQHTSPSLWRFPMRWTACCSAPARI